MYGHPTNAVAGVVLDSCVDWESTDDGQEILFLD